MGLTVTHRVKNSDNDTVGFLIGNKFYNNSIIESNISKIDNLSITRAGVFRAKSELPFIKYSDITKANAQDLNKRNPFKRNIQSDLYRWKVNGAKQVIRLLGPRQCGKTTEVLRFGYSNYENVIYINLADDRYKFLYMIENRESNLEWMNSILDAYCKAANLPKFLNNRKTLLIIDEIQLSTNLYNSIRALKSEFNCDMIITGSYLAITFIKKEYFVPMGTVMDMSMLPLSFSEFCGIFGKRKILSKIDIFSENITDENKELDHLYEIYRQIGGYPEVVKRFIDTQSIDEANGVLGTLLHLFKNESAVYLTSSRQIDIFKSAFEQSIIQMCSGNKNNNVIQIEDLTNLINRNTKSLATRKEVIETIKWLQFSRIIGTCSHCIDGELSNIIPAKRIYYLDCGVANYLINNTPGVNKSNAEGMLTETFAFSELYRLHIANTYVNKLVKGETPIFSTLGTYELDFIEEDKQGIVYGIEIKTTRGNPKSLKVYVQKGLVDKGILAKMTSGHKGEKISSIPIWAIGCRFPYNN